MFAALMCVCVCWGGHVRYCHNPSHRWPRFKIELEIPCTFYISASNHSHLAVFYRFHCIVLFLRLAVCVVDDVPYNLVYQTIDRKMVYHPLASTLICQRCNKQAQISEANRPFWLWSSSVFVWRNFFKFSM